MLARISKALATNFHMKSFALSLAFIVRFTATRKWCIVLPRSGDSSQFVFPSPTYPGLQEQLYDPTVFVQEARLGRQS